MNSLSQNATHHTRVLETTLTCFFIKRGILHCILCVHFEGHWKVCYCKSGDDEFFPRRTAQPMLLSFGHTIARVNRGNNFSQCSMECKRQKGNVTHHFIKADHTQTLNRYLCFMKTSLAISPTE